MVCMDGGIQHENKSKTLNKPKPRNAYEITRRDCHSVILRIFVLQDEYSVSPPQFLETDHQGWERCENQLNIPIVGSWIITITYVLRVISSRTAVKSWSSISSERNSSRTREHECLKALINSEVRS